MKFSKRLFRFSVVFSFVLGVLFVLSASASAQQSGSNFDPGRIIDDGIFWDPATMSVAEIQDFLEDMVDGGNEPDGVNGTCDVNGTQLVGSITRAQYSTNSYNSGGNGIQPPFVCLPDYRENPNTGENNYWEYNESQDRYENVTGSNPSGSRTAAQLIHDVAQDYDINPQVLIVLLQKEQSLITDDWPWGRQYEIATGYGCPDSAPCSDQYYGLYNQLDNAAWQFNRYRDLPNNYSHVAGQNNSVRYHPNSSCGSSTVFIENQATAGLYNYTPYQPNSSALSNMYGTGNSCSSYGNRNFWRLFRDWFGATTTDYHSRDYWRYKHETAFRGDTKTAQLWYENTGTVDWYDEIGVASAPSGTRKVMLYTARDVGRTSIFNKTWTSGGKIVAARNFDAVYESDGTTLASNQHRARPGQIVKYKVRFDVPTNAPYKKHREYFQPSVYQRPDWLNDPGSFIDITVKKETYRSSDYYRYRHRKANPGSAVTGEAWFKNTGNVPWYDESGVKDAPSGTKKVMLYTSRSVGKASPFGTNWGSGRNVAARNFAAVYESNGKTLAADQDKVEPGQIAKFNITFDVLPTAKAGKYRNYFQPSLFQNSSAFNDPGSFLDITVTRNAKYRSSDYYRYKHETANPGDTVTAEAWYRNTGNISWYDEKGAKTAPVGTKKVMLYTARDIGESNVLGLRWGSGKNVPGRNFTAVYKSDGVTLSEDQHRVRPGQIAMYEIVYRVPGSLADGKYRNYFQPSLFQNSKAFNDPGSFLDVNVK